MSLGSWAFGGGMARVEGALAFRRGVLRNAGGSRKLNQLGAVMGRVMKGETLSGRLWGVGRYSGEEMTEQMSWAYSI